MAKITSQMYKKAMEDRRPLLKRSRVLVQENGEFYWEDAPPWQVNPSEIDDGYGALHGRGQLRPISTTKLEPRAQGSMPGRAATAVLLKERARRDREFDPLTGKIVSNRLPSEQSHRRLYSTKPARATLRLADGRKIVVGRSGRVLKVATEKVNKVPRGLRSSSGWRILVETEG